MARTTAVMQSPTTDRSTPADWITDLDLRSAAFHAR